MNKALKIILLAGVVLLIVSHVMKNKLPDSRDIVAELQQEPIQIETDEQPFQLKKEDRVYTITPRYEYELYGLVVSLHHAGNWLDYAHERWGDTLNIKDLCVLWGGNVKNNLYHKFKFTSADWTCNFRTDNQAAWEAFRQDELSNNHILVDEKQLKRAIMSVRRGDQIYIKGFLAEYAHDGGFKRGTSTTRTDRGNGACETIFVTEVRILKRANLFWNYLNLCMKYVIVLSLVLLVISFFRGTPEM